jgi:hypothetical protein
MPPLALCDEEIEIRNPPDFPVRGLYQGHDGVRRWRDQVFDIFDNARVEPEEIVDVRGDGETVLRARFARASASSSRASVFGPIPATVCSRPAAAASRSSFAVRTPSARASSIERFAPSPR